MKLSSKAITTELAWGNFVAPVGSKWLHKYGGSYEVTGHVFSTERNQVEIQYRRFDGPDFDPVLDPAIPFTRPVNQWTLERFAQIQ